MGTNANLERIPFFPVLRRWYSKKLSTIRNRTSCVFRAFQTSNFYVPFLLIFTYLVLTVVPSITRSFRYLLGYKIPFAWTFFYLCSIRVSYTVNGVIYVFLQRRVRRLLRRTFQGPYTACEVSDSAQPYHPQLAKNVSTEC